MQLIKTEGQSGENKLLIITDIDQIGEFAVLQSPDRKSPSYSYVINGMTHCLNTIHADVEEEHGEKLKKALLERI